jgi:hypothetical protein
MFTERRQYMATGTATLTGERLELRGWYIGGSTPNRAVSLTLTKTGETLEGTGRGVENDVPSWRPIKGARHEIALLALAPVALVRPAADQGLC